MDWADRVNKHLDTTKIFNNARIQFLLDEVKHDIKMNYRYLPSAKNIALRSRLDTIHRDLRK